MANPRILRITFFVAAGLLMLAAIWSLMWVFSSASLACTACNCSYSLFDPVPRCRQPYIAGILSLVSLILAVGAIIFGQRQKRKM